MDKEYIIKVLATPTGDSLKAMVLREVEGLTLGVPKKPDNGPVVTGSAAAGYRQQIGKPEPVTAPVEQTRISAPPKPMPANIRFTDIEEEPKPVASVQQGVEKEWLSVVEAASVTGLTVNTIRTYCATKGLEKRQAPGGRTIEIKRSSLLPLVKQSDA